LTVAKPGLTREASRALALRAQGFGDEGLRDPIDVLDRLGAIQLDSVNVLARSQEIVPFSRIGPFPLDSMHRSIYRERRGFEYWGHMASWLPMADYRYFLPRMEAIRDWGRANWTWRSASEYAHLFPPILERIRAEGPLAVDAFAEAGGARGGSWDPRPAKAALEILFARGELMAADRTSSFVRLYDLPERVLPSDLDVSKPEAAEAERYLFLRAIRALGVATLPAAADYYRQRLTEWRPQGTHWKTAFRELVGTGEVVEVAVEGWKSPALVAAAALEGPLDLPTHPPTFLSPFDSLLWEHKRVEQLFDFHHQIEIFVPGPKRAFGYYVLPLLARGKLAGRAELKLDRAAGALVVQSLWLEGTAPEDAATAMRDLAEHLGARSIALERVEPAAESATLRALVG
jgi:uncharacterized protein